MEELVVTNGQVWMRKEVARGRRRRNGDPGVQPVWTSASVADVLEAIAREERRVDAKRQQQAG